jgi:hypothetical protein
MSNTMTMTLVLAGHYAGKTVRLGNFQFVDGETTFSGNGEQIISVTRIMARGYNAHLKGSVELANAQATYDAEMERIHGKRDIQGENRAGEHEAVSDVQSSGSGSTEVQTDAGEPDVEPETGSEGVLSNGSGLQDAGDDDESDQKVRMSNNFQLEKIIHSLDPENDEHWTQGGMPRLSAIEEALDGDTGITRADVNNAAPGYDREKALNSLFE